MTPRTAHILVPIALAGMGSCALPDGDPPEGGARFTIGATPARAPGVHNVVRVSPGVYSGSAPDGDAGFDTLAALGVRTVVSVDAARPDVERARGRAMRYVHVPVEYAGPDRAEGMSLARAVRDLPRPIYVHCHHGEHRGPAAAATALRLIGELSRDEALALLETAGTSPSYPGLWERVREAAPAPTAELDAWGAELPETAEVGGFAEGMALLDRVYDRIGLVRDSGWSAPPDHPDLVPAALAGQAADVLRTLSEQTDEPEHTAAWMVSGLRAAGVHAAALERALIAGDTGAAEVSWSRVAASCRDCHAKHRDAP